MERPPYGGGLFPLYNSVLRGKAKRLSINLPIIARIVAVSYKA